jgi:hypothetical protein
MKKTTKKIGVKAETLRNLTQHEIHILADHELDVVAGGSSWFACYSEHCSSSNRSI